MKYLLDTQILIWAIEQKDKLTKEVKEILETSSSIYVSIESLREIAIKHKAGDISFKMPFHNFINKLQIDFGIKIINTELNHVLQFYELNAKPKHKDPFDHIIICTAIKSKCTIISSDDNFPFYRNQGLQLIEN